MNRIFGKSRGQIVRSLRRHRRSPDQSYRAGTDVDVMYMDWQPAQKVADAAAIAGANYLAGYKFTGTPANGCSSQPDAATTAACTYAVDNGFTAANVTLTEPTGSTIKVVAQLTSRPYYFAKALGMSTYAVSATAAAQAGGPIGTVTQGLFPVGLQCTSPCNLSSLDPGQAVSFGSKFVGGLAPGNWQFSECWEWLFRVAQRPRIRHDRLIHNRRLDYVGTRQQRQFGSCESRLVGQVEQLRHLRHRSVRDRRQKPDFHGRERSVPSGRAGGGLSRMHWELFHDDRRVCPDLSGAGHNHQHQY